MKKFAVTIVTMRDVAEQPVVISALTTAPNPIYAVKEVVSDLEKSTLMHSCIRSVSVHELCDTYDPLTWYKTYSNPIF